MRTIEVSDETYEKIKGQIEADRKPKFKPVVCHCLKISVREKLVVIETQPIYEPAIGCTQDSAEARYTAKTILSAVDFVEKKK